MGYITASTVKYIQLRYWYFQDIRDVINPRGATTSMHVLDARLLGWNVYAPSPSHPLPSPSIQARQRRPKC